MASPRSPTKPVAVVEDDNAPMRYENSGAPPAPPYVYQSLPSSNHFRLLTLFPGRFADKLKCEINTYSLAASDAPPYSAVSYTWNESQFDRLVIAGKRIAIGDELRTKYSIRHPLWCDSKSSGKGKLKGLPGIRRLGNQGDKHRLLISTNLRDLLRRFRDPVKRKVLWIDAICINQDDLDERAAQIVTMQRIYHEAEQVLFWLGEEGDESTAALRLLNQLNKVTHGVEQGTITSPLSEDLLHNPEAIAKLGLPPYPHSADWKALMKFLERPVFSRIWIIQELVAAKKIIAHCGGAPATNFDVFFDGLRFLHGVGWISTISSQLSKGVDNTQFLAAIVPIKMAWMEEPSLELRQTQRKRLLTSTRNFAATDPRDKVFALIGLINDYGHRELHGIDRPDDSSRPNATLDKHGKVHMKFKVHPGGKSDSDLALEIFHSTKQADILELRQKLLVYLEVSMQVANAVLNPSPENHTEAFANRLTEALEGIADCTREFDSGKSKDHERVFEFANRVIKMFMSHTVGIGEALMESSADRLKQVLKSRDGQRIVEENDRLYENLEFFAKCLRLVPDGKGGFIDEIEASPSQSKEMSVGVIGNREVLDSLDYSVEFENQFQDWAWSSAGWTVPNYRKPVVEVYTQFAVKCMQDDKTLDVLATVEDKTLRNIQGLPSWVPDLTVPFERHQLQRVNKSETSLYAACGSAQAEVGWSVDAPHLIEVEALPMGKITALSNEDHATNTLTSLHIAEWEKLIKDVPSLYLTGEPAREAFWRTLVGDCAGKNGRTESPAPAEFGQYYSALVESQKIEETQPSRDAIQGLIVSGKNSPQSLATMLQQSDAFKTATAKVMLGRRLSVTSKGELCAVPVSSRIGDQIFVLKGGAVPFVLRRTNANNGHFELIGECYVHGFMFGEALQAEGSIWERITLV